MKVLFDTSVLVAALVNVHQAYERSFSWLKKTKSGEIDFLVCAHTLSELYSVLTTLPVSPKITPALAHRLIKENIESSASIVELTSDDYKRVLRSLSDSEATGGIIFDALIAQAAQKSDADILLTLNLKDFNRLSLKTPPEIKEP